MILSVGSLTGTLPLNLNMLGIGHRQAPINRPSGIPLYQWFLCVKGSGEFVSDQQRSVVSEGQGLLIYPDIPHIYHSLSSDWTVDFIGFSGPVCPDLLLSLSMNRSGVYHLADPEVFRNAVNRLYRLYRGNSDSDSKKIALSSECYTFLLRLSREIAYLAPSDLAVENQTLKAVLNYLEQNYSQPVTLSDLADNIGLTKEYLCFLFKKEMNQTIMHHLLTLRISHARICLVQYPDKKISEISKMCGFESPGYFGQIFRREVGMTPDQFRKVQ